MEAFASDGGMIPEQIWDAPDVPERELFFGQPSGLGHAAGLGARRVHQAAPLAARRPGVRHAAPAGEALPGRRRASRIRALALQPQVPPIPAGKLLRLEVLAPAVVRWSADDWLTTHDAPTRDTGLGVHVADLHLPMTSRLGRPSNSRSTGPQRIGGKVPIRRAGHTAGRRVKEALMAREAT